MIIGIAVVVVILLAAVGWLLIPSVRDKTFAEAIRGTWTCTWGPTEPFLMVVGDDTYVLGDPGGDEEVRGSWAVQEGVLTIRALFNRGPIQIEVPDTVRDRLDLTLVTTSGTAPITVTVTEGGDHFKVQTGFGTALGASTGGENDYLECDR